MLKMARFWAGTGSAIFLAWAAVALRLARMGKKGRDMSTYTNWVLLGDPTKGVAVKMGAEWLGVRMLDIPGIGVTENGEDTAAVSIAAYCITDCFGNLVPVRLYQD